MQLDCPASRAMVKSIFISYLALDILLRQQRTEKDIISHLDEASVQLRGLHICFLCYTFHRVGIILV